MIIDHNAATDFSDIIDGTESLVLRRQNNLQSVSIIAARRQSVVTQEAVPSGGAAQQADAVWHFPLPVGELAPKLGDALVDGQGGRWTILEIRELPSLGRWKCETRELSVAYGCVDRVDIERAVWGDIGSGPEIVAWVYAFTALPVKIQPEDMKVVAGSVPTVTNSRFHIILSESILLEPDDRFLAEDGTIYTLESYEQTDRIDALPIAKVLRQDV